MINSAVAASVGRRVARLLVPGVAVVAAATVAGAGHAHAPRSPRVSTLIAGAALPGANGMAIDHRGNLVVASGGASRITTIDPRDGRPLATLTAASAGVTYPDDVAVGPDGSLYWTEFTVGDVVRRTPGGRTSTVARLGPGVNPIAFAADGRLFVGKCFLDDALYEVDPAGRRAPRLVAEDIGAGCAANGMDFGADGRLYAPQPTLSRIVVIDVDTARVDVVADGFGPALFGVDVAPDGQLFAVDTGSLKRIDPRTGSVTVVGALGFLADNLVVDDTGAVYVSSLTDAAVVQVRPDGTIRTVSPGGVVLPQGVARTGAQLLVADGASVTAYTTRPLTRGATITTGAPFAAASVHPAGREWITTGPLERTVRLFSPASGTSRVVADDLTFPLDAIAVAGRYLVADAGSRHVLSLPADDPGRATVLSSVAEVPAGLAGYRGDVWVSDIRRGRIWQIMTGNRPMARPRLVAAGLARPQGMAVGRPGQLIVSETATGRLTRIDLTTGRRKTLATGLTPANPAPAGQPTDGLYFGVTATRDGTVHAADPLRNRVLRIRS